MKYKLAFFLFVVFAGSQTAESALIIDITGTPGLGQSTWKFSGSATVTSGFGYFEQSGDIVLREAWVNVGNYTTVNDFDASKGSVILGGSANVSVNGNTRGIRYGYIDDDASSGVYRDEFGVGIDGASDLTFTMGDTISWIGEILTNIDINSFDEIPLPFSFSSSNFGDTGTLDLTVNVSSVPALPQHAIAFDNRSAWRNAAGGGLGDLTEDFESATSDLNFSGSTQSIGFLKFSESFGGSDWARIDSLPFNWGGYSPNGSAYALLRSGGIRRTTVEFPSVYSIGFDYNSGYHGAPWDQPMRVDTSSGATFTLPGPGAGFFGIVSSQPFSRLTFSGVNEIRGTDNWGAYATSAVPEPSSFLMALISITGIGLSHLRQSRKLPCSLNHLSKQR